MCRIQQLWKGPRAMHVKQWTDFFSELTRIDVSFIEPHDYKFRNLVVESRLETVFAGRPKGFKVPNYKIYKYEYSEGLAVVFQVETRLIMRYIPPHCESDLLEIE